MPERPHLMLMFVLGARKLLAAQVLLLMGFSLVIGPMFAKNYRIYVVFSSAQEGTISDDGVFFLTAMLVVCQRNEVVQ